MVEVALVIDPKTKTWSGELPRNCRSVYLEFLFAADGKWHRATTGRVIPKKEGIEKLEMFMNTKAHLCKHEAYRLVPAADEFNEEEGDENMAAKKKAAAAEKPPKAELVAGRFRANSINGRLFLAFEDRKPHTLAEIAKLCKAGSLNNLEKGKIPQLHRHGRTTKTFEIAKLDGGKYQMVNYGLAPKTEPKEDKKPAAKTAPAKPNGKAASAPAGKAPAKKKAAAKKSKPNPNPPPEDLDDLVDDLPEDEEELSISD